LVQTSPEQAKNLLTQNPQLCYALFQGMIIMKVIRPEIVTVRLFSLSPTLSNMELLRISHFEF
jgi:cleavage stimulation factor subunit 2